MVHAKPFALAALLLSQAHVLLAETPCGCDAERPALTTVTWTIVATVEPTITGWEQMIDRICPTPWPQESNNKPYQDDSRPAKQHVGDIHRHQDHASHHDGHMRLSSEDAIPEGSHHKQFHHGHSSKGHQKNIGESERCDLGGCFIRYVDPFLGPPFQPGSGSRNFRRPPHWVPWFPISPGHPEATGTMDPRSDLPVTGTQTDTIAQPTDIGTSTSGGDQTFTLTSTGANGPTTITITTSENAVSTGFLPTSSSSASSSTSPTTTQQTTVTLTSIGPDGTTTLTTTSDLVPQSSNTVLTLTTLTTQISPSSAVSPSTSVSTSESASPTLVTTTVTSDTTTATPSPTTAITCPDISSGSFQNNDLGAWYISEEVTADSRIVETDPGEYAFDLIPSQVQYAQVFLNQRLDPCGNPPPQVEFRMTFRYRFTGASDGCRISGNVNREPTDFFTVVDDGLSPGVWQVYQGPVTPVQLTYDSLFTLKLVCEEDTARTPAIEVTDISVYGLP